MFVIRQSERCKFTPTTYQIRPDPLGEPTSTGKKGNGREEREKGEKGGERKRREVEGGEVLAMVPPAADSFRRLWVPPSQSSECQFGKNRGTRLPLEYCKLNFLEVLLSALDGRALSRPAGVLKHSPDPLAAMGTYLYGRGMEGTKGEGRKGKKGRGKEGREEEGLAMVPPARYLPPPMGTTLSALSK